jgi:hypothetical protein
MRIVQNPNEKMGHPPIKLGLVLRLKPPIDLKNPEFYCQSIR